MQENNIQLLEHSVVDAVADASKDSVVLSIRAIAKPDTRSRVADFVNKKGKVPVKGFRPGHAPGYLLEKTLGLKRMYQPDLEDQVVEICDHSLHKRQIKKAEIEEVKLNDKKIEFTAKVEVFHDYDVIPENYEGINLKKEELTEDKKAVAVENHLKSLQEQNSIKIPVEDRLSQEGDLLTVNFSGKVEDKELATGKINGYKVKLGSDNVYGFEPKLLGLNVGASAEISATVPETFHVEEFRGKQAFFEVSIESIHIVEIPAIDEELAKKVGKDSLEVVKEEFLKQYVEQMEYVYERNFENNVLAEVIKNVNIKIPESVLDNEVQGIVNRRFSQLAELKLPREQVMQLLEKIDFNLIKQQAAARLATALIFDKVVEKGLFALDSVSEEDVVKYKESEEYNKEEKLDSDTLKKQVLYRRFVEHVKTHAKFSENQVTSSDV